MFTLKNKEQMQKAIETARRHHPHVKVLALGSYLVSNSSGGFHIVSMKRDGQHKAIDCACVAGSFGSPCYHAAAALSVHMGLVRMRRGGSDIVTLLAPTQKQAERVGRYTI